MTKGDRNKDSSRNRKRGRNIIKGENHKDILIYDIGERYDKGKESIKILSTQVGGASS